MSAVADKLDEARALIERGWTKGSFARGKSGRDVDWQGRAAVCFCAGGAIRRVDYWGAHELYRALADAIGLGRTSKIHQWNDAPERTQAEVIDAFKRAAELARAGDQ